MILFFSEQWEYSAQGEVMRSLNTGMKYAGSAESMRPAKIKKVNKGKVVPALN
jgi:hypothetical protein